MKKYIKFLFVILCFVFSGCSIDYETYYEKYGDISNKKERPDSFYIDESITSYPNDNFLLIEKYGDVYADLSNQYEVYSSYYSSKYDTLYISYDNINNPTQELTSKDLAMIEEHLLYYFVSDPLRLEYKEYLKVVRIYPDYHSSVCRSEEASEEEYSSIEGCALYDAIDSGKELEFKKIIEKLREKAESCSLTELVDLVLETTGMKKELEDEDSMEADIRLENLEEFKTITKNFEEKNGIISLEEFLAEISLVSDVEEHKNNSDVITLMTVHSAKGLEFDYVFIIGLEEGIFPHNNSLFEAEALEEERRLCYVAITRAKKSLYLINARKRTIYGMDSYNAPSRFIEEINEELLDSDVVKEEKIIRKFDKIEINDNIDYTVGEKISHDSFGEGVIVSVDKSILTVAFPHPYGIKKLLKGHKTFRKI